MISGLERPSFLGSELRVDAASRVVAEPVEHDDVEDVVGVAVADSLSRCRWTRPLLAGTGAA